MVKMPDMLGVVLGTMIFLALLLAAVAGFLAARVLIHASESGPHESSDRVTAEALAETITERR